MSKVKIESLGSPGSYVEVEEEFAPFVRAVFSHRVEITDAYVEEDCPENVILVFVSEEDVLLFSEFVLRQAFVALDDGTDPTLHGTLMIDLIDVEGEKEANPLYFLDLRRDLVGRVTDAFAQSAGAETPVPTDSDWDGHMVSPLSNVDRGDVVMLLFHGRPHWMEEVKVRIQEVGESRLIGVVEEDAKVLRNVKVGTIVPFHRHDILQVLSSDRDIPELPN